MRRLAGFSAWCSVFILGLTQIAGCNDQLTEAAEDDGRSVVAVTDAAGATIRLDAPAERVIAIDATALEMLIEMGAPPVLRGPSFGEAPEAWEAVEVLSFSHAAGPSVEQVLAADPDLIVVSPTYARFAGPLERITDAPVMTIEVRSLDDAARTARQLGVLTGHESRGESLAKKIESIEPATDDASGEDRPRVAALFGAPGAYFEITDRSYLADLVGRAGGEFVTTGAAEHPVYQGVAPLSLERLIALDPEVLIVVGHGRGTPIESTGPWASLSAVGNERVVYVSDRQFVMAPGTEIDDAYARMQEAVGLAR